jgi:hypothetical protein
MRVTQIEVSYRLTESAEWNNVQVERRVTVEYPKERTPADCETIATEAIMAGHANALKHSLQKDCERDVDDWLEAHHQAPRYYRGLRYVAWNSYRGRVAVILPVGEEPKLDLGWHPISPEAGMRLAPLRRHVRAWVGRQYNRNRWLLCAQPAKVGEFLEAVRGLEQQAFVDDGDRDGVYDDLDANDSDRENDDQPF